jgi:hypothetical protein
VSDDSRTIEALGLAAAGTASIGGLLRVITLASKTGIVFRQRLALTVAVRPQLQRMGFSTSAPHQEWIACTSSWRYSAPFSRSLLCVFMTSFFRTPTTCAGHRVVCAQMLKPRPPRVHVRRYRLALLLYGCTSTKVSLTLSPKLICPMYATPRRRRLQM